LTWRATSARPWVAAAAAVEDGTCDVMYQRRNPESPQLLAASGGADGGIVGGVSGQMFLRANDAAVRVLTAAAAAAWGADTAAGEGDAAALGDAVAGVDDSEEIEKWACAAAAGGAGAVKSCKLPDTFASSCWGMLHNAVTFHANCIPDDNVGAAPAVDQKAGLGNYLPAKTSNAFGTLIS